MDEKTLKDCPFCGDSEAALESMYVEPVTVWFVHCEYCEGHTGDHPTEAAAIAAWNIRTPAQSQEGEREKALLAKLDDLTEQMCDSKYLQHCRCVYAIRELVTAARKEER